MNESFGLRDDLYSDVAQLGTPYPFDTNNDDMPMFCSQSSISMADCMSEMSSQFEFVQFIQTQYN